MHVTIHLTTSCNMRCGYCYAPPSQAMDMSLETAERAVDFAAGFDRENNTGIIFFGGEPLLKKEVIYHTVAYCNRQRKERGRMFHFKVTTNGLLLDQAFLEFARLNRVAVALSIDGTGAAHDTHRREASGAPTFDRVDRAADLLLAYQPYASALMVVSPETVGSYAESAAYLFGKGFRYLIVSFNYAGAWTGEHLRELTRQYKRLARLYEKMTLQEKKFYLSPFEMKLATHIGGDRVQCYRCVLAQRRISVAPDGSLYPCVQFVRDGVSNREFRIGTVDSGVDETKRSALYERSQRMTPECEACAFKRRCHNSCSCLNRQTTGRIDTVPPVLCESERILIPIVDAMGERLYRKRAPAFIQKQYNPAYPLMSLMEDAGIAV